MQALVVALQHKRHIIWDWNGTLLDDVEHNVATMNWLLTAHGLPPITIEHHKEHFGFPVKLYYEKLGFDVSPDPFASLCERFNHRFHETLGSCSLADGALSTLELLHGAGKKQSILSATEQTALQRSISSFGIEHAFSHIYGIETDQASSKLDRGHELLAVSGLPPEDTVLVGDTIHDLEVGSALGVDVILVAHGHQSNARLQAVHDVVLQWETTSYR